MAYSVYCAAVLYCCVYTLLCPGSPFVATAFNLTILFSVSCAAVFYCLLILNLQSWRWWRRLVDGAHASSAAAVVSVRNHSYRNPYRTAWLPCTALKKVGNESVTTTFISSQGQFWVLNGCRITKDIRRQLQHVTRSSYETDRENFCNDINTAVNALLNLNRLHTHTHTHTHTNASITKQSYTQKQRYIQIINASNSLHISWRRIYTVRDIIVPSWLSEVQQNQRSLIAKTRTLQKQAHLIALYRNCKLSVIRLFCLPFLLQDRLHGFPGLLLILLSISVITFYFSVLHFLVVGSVR